MLAHRSFPAFIVLRGRSVSPYLTYYLARNHDFRGTAIKSMIGSIEASKAKNPEPPSHETTHEFAMVDVTKNAAVAKIKIFRDGKHIYSDYMALYKFDDGWKMVNKIYAEH